MIRVLAGTNGAGKSSIGGAQLRRIGADYYNPDEVARALLKSGVVAGLPEANSLAWKRGVDELKRAIIQHSDFTFETTLGGATVTRLLSESADSGLEVHIWYVALESADLHVERVRARVAEGGHDIPEGRIRERYDASRRNLIRLLPRLTSLRVFDNSAPPDPETGFVEPRLLLHTALGSIVHVAPDPLPAWVRPIVEAARAS
ncbi:MAG: ZTL protein [Gemmatimonas sp.]|nr:ZTL protein [Gemmatimonas sp.]